MLGHRGSDKAEKQCGRGRDYAALGPRVLPNEGLVCETVAEKALEQRVSS